MASRKASFGGGLALAIVLLLAVTVFVNKIVGDLKLGRFDLTENRVYTISDGAKRILGRLDVPVQVKYYVTKNDEMPAGLKTLQQEVTDKLQELSIASNRRLEYMIVDPKESEELEDALIQKGVRPFQVQSVERDALAVKLVYSSLAISYKDKPEEIIPQVLPDQMPNLEYAVVSNVMKLTRESNPVVAIYSTKDPVDPEMVRLYMQMGQQAPPPTDNYTYVREILQAEGYDVRPVEITEESPIPEDAGTLVLFAPRELNDRQRYEISRVLERGGNVIVAAQALVYDYNPGPRGGFNMSVRTQKMGINDLLTRYGVRIDDRMLMDERMATLAIPRTANLGGLRFQMTEPVQAEMQIRVMSDGINQDLPLTAGVPELLYLWGTQLILDDQTLADDGLSVTPVLNGSDNSWIVDKKSGAVTQADRDPEKNEPVARPLLAAMIEGTFPDPWEGKEVPAWPSASPDDESANATDDSSQSDAADTTRAGEQAGETATAGRLLVMACGKLFEDMLIEQPAHRLFFQNSVDALSLGTDVISIRSKQAGPRTISEPSDAGKLMFRLANMALVPVLVIAFGLVRLMVRRREEDEYLRQHAAARGGRKP